MTAALAHFARIVPERMPREVVLVGIPARNSFAWADSSESDADGEIDRAANEVLSALREGILGV